MSVKRTGQLGFGEVGLARRSGSAALERVSVLVDWAGFERTLAGLREDGPGRPGYRPLLLFKALLLQAWYGLSDAELEFRLGDSLAFGRFVGLSLEDEVPDHTTLCRSGKPGSTHGYKAHVGVDQGSGLIRSILTTPANVNDTLPADALIRGDEKAVLGDAAYHTHARQAALKAQGVKPRLMRRPNKHHPTLPPRLARLNRLIARRRAAVETTFATWKRRMGLSGIRYIGLTKASGQMLMVALAFNLRRWAALQPA
jgi:IS5 family transposase